MRGPLRVALLNLMPMKQETERDFLRLFDGVSSRVEISWMKLRSHVSRHVSLQYMEERYDFFDVLKELPFDGLIITGAPVETLSFEEVDYWRELEDVFEWAHQHVRSTLYICWGAQAGLYHFFGVPKHALPKKMFGIFEQSILAPEEPLFYGFKAPFMMPHSRHTEVRKADLVTHKELRLLAESPVTGVSMMMTPHGKEIFITGHLEYAADTLDREYHRDLGKRSDVGLPLHYYKDDDPTEAPVDSWHGQALRLYENWTNYYLCDR